MTKTTLVLLLTLGWFIFARWYYVCAIKQNNCCKDIAKTETGVLTMEKLGLKEGATNILEGYDQFAFAPGTFAATPSANNQEFLDKVTAYFKANPDKNLKITGFYLPSEKDAPSGIFENIGLARADAIRNLLMKAGIAQDRISLSSQMLEGTQMAETLRFDVIAAPKAGTKELKQEAFTFFNMSFSDANFDYNSDEFNPGRQFGLYADSLVTYTKANPKAAITLTGHTDNRGEDQYNNDLGKKRAEAVKAYLVGKGVKATISTATKGETEPVAPNDTEENMRKNRRVNVRIQ